jgi:hypothetical protein
MDLWPDVQFMPSGSVINQCFKRRPMILYMQKKIVRSVILLRLTRARSLGLRYLSHSLHRSAQLICSQEVESSTIGVLP